MRRLHPCHRAPRYGDAGIKFATEEGWQNHRPRVYLSVWKPFQIETTVVSLIRIPAVRTAFVLVRRGFPISGKSRQKHRIIKEADPHRRSDHRDENPEAHREKSCKYPTHRWCSNCYVCSSIESRGLFPASGMTLSKAMIPRRVTDGCGNETIRPVSGISGCPLRNDSTEFTLTIEGSVFQTRSPCPVPQRPRIVICGGDTPGSLPPPGRRKHPFPAGSKAGFEGYRDPTQKQTRRRWEGIVSSGGRCGGTHPQRWERATKRPKRRAVPAWEEPSSLPNQYSRIAFQKWTEWHQNKIPSCDAYHCLEPQHAPSCTTLPPRSPRLRERIHPQDFQTVGSNARGQIEPLILVETPGHDLKLRKPFKALLGQEKSSALVTAQCIDLVSQLVDARRAYPVGVSIQACDAGRPPCLGFNPSSNSSAFPPDPSAITFHAPSGFCRVARYCFSPRCPCWCNQGNFTHSRPTDAISGLLGTADQSSLFRYLFAYAFRSPEAVRIILRHVGKFANHRLSFCNSLPFGRAEGALR